MKATSLQVLSELQLTAILNDSSQDNLNYNLLIELHLINHLPLECQNLKECKQEVGSVG